MSGYAIELIAPDIAPWREGNTGVPYYTRVDSGRPGPHAMINAVTHGNELCGAIAVDLMLRQGLTPTRGALTLGFANVEAYHAFDPAEPTASRFLDEDFNRVWDPAILDGPRQSRELRRAREIRPLIDTVDQLLDIHSMQHRTVPLMLAGPEPKGRGFAVALGAPEMVVVDAGHKAGRRLRDYPPFVAPGPKNALLIECGQHWEAAAADVAIDSAFRFLLALDMVDPDTAAPHLLPAPKRQRVIEVTDAVTIESDDFRFAQDFIGMEVLPERGTPIGHDGDRLVVTPYDDCVLIMPSRRLSRGLTAVRLGRIVA
jgi:predicted deacylase